MPDNQLLIEAQPATASRILGNLWMGDAPPIGYGVKQYFDHLVLCAMEYQLDPALFPGVNVIHAPMNDDGSPMTVDEMKIAVRTAGQVIRHLKNKERVLVSCMQGRNRSGIVTALALCLGAKHMPQQAVQRIRFARGPNAMKNRDFLWFLQKYCSRSEG